MYVHICTYVRISIYVQFVWNTLRSKVLWILHLTAHTVGTLHHSHCWDTSPHTLLGHFTTHTVHTPHHSHCLHTSPLTLFTHLTTHTVYTPHHSHCSHTSPLTLLTHLTTHTVYTPHHSHCTCSSSSCIEAVGTVLCVQGSPRCSRPGYHPY